MQVLSLTQQNIIATKANDVLGIRDYEKIHPLIHNIINAGKKVRWYFEMDRCSITNSTGLWEDGTIEVKYGTLDFMHTEDIEKIALVGNKRLEKCMRSIMVPFKNAIIKYFDLPEKEDAIDWIKSKEE